MLNTLCSAWAGGDAGEKKCKRCRLGVPGVQRERVSPQRNQRACEPLPTGVCAWVGPSDPAGSFPALREGILLCDVWLSQSHEAAHGMLIWAHGGRRAGVWGTPQAGCVAEEEPGRGPATRLGPHSLDSCWGGGRKRRPTLVASVGSLLGAGVITRPRSAVFDADTFSASSPLCPHLGAQVRKSGPSLLWHQWGVPPGAHLAAEHTPVLGRRLPRPRPQIPHPHPRGLGLRGLTALTMLRLLVPVTWGWQTAPVTWGWQTVRSVTDAVWLAAVCRPGHTSA